MRDYSLVIKVNVSAFDDPDARKVIRQKIKDGELFNDADVKLQEIFAKQQPRKVEFSI